MRPMNASAVHDPMRVFATVVALFFCLFGAGCAMTMPRDALPEWLVDEAELAGMPGVRIWGDASAKSLDALVRAESPKMRALAAARERAGRSAALNLVAISGGAEDGAFGAGLLVGWSDAGTRPDFDLVTGVSAGALIAPFVYLGRDRDPQIKELFTKYAQEDILSTNVVSGLFGGAALADSAPLANLIAKYVDERFLRDVARERMKGRILLVGTTNLDAQRPVLWDMGRIAMSNHPQALNLFRKVLLASASIPGVFAPVRIQVRANGRAYEELHVDGGVTQQVFVAPPSVAMNSVDPGVKRLTRRLFIIRNGKISPEWQPIKANALSIAGRSLSTLTKSQGIGDLYRIYSTTQRDSTEFNLAVIPSAFDLKSPEPFDQGYMRALYDVGYQAGYRGYPWMKAPPGLAVEPELPADRKRQSPHLMSSSSP
jgi:predicted acylesterase/phospholipase RssA